MIEKVRKNGLFYRAETGVRVNIPGITATHRGGPMNDRSPTEIIHGIIEEQEERELTLMIAEQIERQRKQEATQLVINTTAGNYARVVAEVMRRDGIELNGVDMRNIRIRVLEMLAYNRRVELYREKEKNNVPLEEAGTATAVTC